LNVGKVRSDRTSIRVSRAAAMPAAVLSRRGVIDS
jgi:hypothetical protein